MKLVLFFLSLVGLAHSSTKLDLTFINKALTRIVDKELQDVAECAKKILECEKGKTYPTCLDSPDIPFNSDVNLGEYFILKIMDLDLKGYMNLTNAQFTGFSNFEMRNVSSTVTVIPLGIEFKFVLAWEGSYEFKSHYIFHKVCYVKGGLSLPFTGTGDMSVAFRNFTLTVVAHKLLGDKMDVLRIKPHVDCIEVKFDKLCIGDVDQTDYTTKKFNTTFVNELVKFELLENYVMKFFNDKLYPPKLDSRKLRKESDLLTKLGKCIYDKFPH